MPKGEVPVDPIAAMRGPDSEALPWREVCTRFRGHWALVCITEFGRWQEPLSGIVLAVGTREQIMEVAGGAVAAGVPAGRMLTNVGPSAYSTLRDYVPGPEDPVEPEWLG